MSALEYVGKPPISDSTLAQKKYVDDQYSLLSIDITYVGSRASAEAVNLVNNAYVDSRDNLRAKKANVDSADANYISLTQKGVNSGVASIGSDGYIVPTQVGTILTDRVVKFATATSIFLTGERTVTNSSNVKEYQAATMNIADPGYPYLPIPMAVLMGDSSTATDPGSRRKGTNNLGRLTAISGSGDIVWGQGITSGSYKKDHVYCFPWCAQNATPQNVSPVEGAMTLNLWLSLWQGTTYKFYNTDFDFYAMLWPAG